MDDEQFRKLIRHAQAGDETATERLFVDCHGKLRSHVARSMKRAFARTRIEPEDILQEVYAAAWRRLRSATFDGRAGLIAWMKTIADNKIIDAGRALRSAKRDVARNVAATPGSTSYYELAQRLSAPDATPSSMAARNEAAALLAVQIGRLPTSYRTVVQLRFREGMPVPDVAAIMGRSPEAIHMLCYRALKKLRGLMGASSRCRGTMR